MSLGRRTQPNYGYRVGRVKTGWDLRSGRWGGGLQGRTGYSFSVSVGVTSSSVGINFPQLPEKQDRGEVGWYWNTRNLTQAFGKTCKGIIRLSESTMGVSGLVRWCPSRSVWADVQEDLICLCLYLLSPAPNPIHCHRPQQRGPFLVSSTFRSKCDLGPEGQCHPPPFFFCLPIYRTTKMPSKPFGVADSVFR